MQYRNLGNTGFKTSLLGLGCMRLPFVDGDGNKGVDREAAYELIRYAVDHGINYFDTAMGYHGGESETMLGEALKGGLREKVWITTKQPFFGKTHDEVRRNLEATLKKLRTNYIDMYYMHRIFPGNWEDIQKTGHYELFEKFKAEGLIRHFGFSYHGNYENFSDVVAKYPWEMCMVQHNLLDTKKEVTIAGIKAAAKHGIALAIMEPLRGGGLAYAPGPVEAAYDSYHIKRTPSEWAFRYLADMPEVSVVLSGMSDMAQLKENIAIFSQADMQPNCLSTEEKSIITKARKGYESIVSIPCTECNYCVPCPCDVPIPLAFSLYNDANRFGHDSQPKRAYWFSKNAGRDATNCTNCGECVPKCPQLIDIPKELQVAHTKLDGWAE